MGFTLPSPTSPQTRARALMARKDAIEADITSQLAILAANGNSTMHTQLVDTEGFPRADLDVWAVRTARVRIIELRNDLKDVMNDIAKALEEVYASSSAAPVEETPTSKPETVPDMELLPFARVDGVAPRSPAATAGLQREDLVLTFGSLTKASFAASSLQPLAEVVAANENRALLVKVLRNNQVVTLAFTPRKGWGGRGLLGCHLVPHS